MRRFAAQGEDAGRVFPRGLWWAGGLLCLGVALAGLAGALTGCGATPNFIDVSDYPAEMKANYAIFDHRCSRCHDLDRPITARVAVGGWTQYVRRMSRHPGAGIDEVDQRRIAAFLEYHHRREVARGEAVDPEVP